MAETADTPAAERETLVAERALGGSPERPPRERQSHPRELPDPARSSQHRHRGDDDPPGRRAAGARVADEPRPKLSPLERLELLCDPGSLRVIRSGVRSRRLPDRTAPGDGVAGGSGTVEGRPIFCFAEDQSHLGGSVGEVHADTIVRVQKLAAEACLPVVGFVESAGARMQEGTAALGGYGRIFRQNVALSGRVPQISVITGVSAGGGSYSPALTDFVVMTRESSMFLTGPQIVREVMGEDVDMLTLGGVRVHERNGVCHFVAGDETEAVATIRRLLGYLPSNAEATPPRREPRPPAPGDPGAVVPESARKVYDVHGVVERLVDAGEHLEVAPKWARNVVTTLARIDGRSVGVVANQPKWLGGVLDAESAQKAARFVRMCDAFNLPIVVLVDTPGFMPGTAQERCGVIRHGAKLLHAFAEATVPKVTVVLRQAYGGAYISMNSSDLGADLSLAWPGARIGIMGASQAVTIIHRRELEAAEDPVQARQELAERYAREHLSAQTAACDGFVDEVIEPRDTRTWLSFALSTLEHKRGRTGRSGNLPL